MSFLLAALPLFASVARAQAPDSNQQISSCPANAKYYTMDDGTVYEHCPYSDYQTWSAQVIPNVESAYACVHLCHEANNNTACVWDGIWSYCHVKNQAGNWYASTQFDTITMVSQGEQPVPGMTACPTTPWFYEDASGAIFEVCPNSDYHSDSLEVDWSIPDEVTCIQHCANNTECAFGVWDKDYKACHHKGAGGPWVSISTQFDAIRLIAPPAAQYQPAGLSECPGNATQWTLDDGSVYETCSDTDYKGNSYSVTPNVLSDWDCIHLCNQDVKCQRSVYDHLYNWCHMKDVSSGLTWATSSQFNTGRLIQRGSRSVNPSYSGLGRWGVPVTLPANPVGAYIVPNTNFILGFSSWGDDNFYGADGITQYSHYDWTTGVVSQRTITNTNHDMFCPGISALGDGRIIISGGSDANKASIYDPAQDAFVSAGDLNIARGYQSSTSLSNGKVFTIGGSYSGGVGGKTGEIYDPATNAWTVLGGTDPTPALATDCAANDADDHFWLHAWKNGSVLQAGPSRNMNWYDTNGSGNTIAAGTRGSDTDQMCGVNTMYDAVNGKIWSAGGSEVYTGSPGLTDAHIITIGDTFAEPTVQQVSPLPRARAFANVVILADGKLLVVGGQTEALVFQDDASQFIADMYDPETDTWTELASSIVPRNYHSTSLLLANGAVYSGGGGLCWTQMGASDVACTRNAEHPSLQIFYPPYLFNADGSWATRPSIWGVSTTSDNSGSTAQAGDTLHVYMDSDASLTWSLIRIGSATHTVNTDQRRVPLTATQDGQNFQMTLPDDYGILLRGYWYLFAVNGAGVPAWAHTVQIV